MRRKSLTSKVIGEAPFGTKEDVDAAVAAARAAFDRGSWGHTSGSERAVFLRRIAEGVAKKKDELAAMETTNCGKPFREAQWDMDDVAGTFTYCLFGSISLTFLDADLAEKLDKKQGTIIELPDDRFTTSLSAFAFVK